MQRIPSYFLRVGTILFILNLTPFKVLSQSIEQQRADSVFQLVKKQFNAKQTDSLYALTGNDFKKQISIEKFRDIANDQLFPLGPIKSSSFINFVNNKIAIYKLTFSSAKVKLQLLISLDADNKLNYFQFLPYHDTGSKISPVPTSNPLRSVTDKQIDTAARSYIQKANTVGLSIGVYKNGKISTYNYGETTLANGKLPTENTIYEIGSITKTFTATLLAYYVNQGKVKLSDPITKYLPDSVASNFALQAITLVELINHTSGLPSLPDNIDLHTDSLNPYKNYTEKLLFSYMRTYKLNGKPGEKYSYSNLGVGLLGAILERISHKTYAQMVNEIITKPLQMNSTAQYLTPQMQDRFVTVYNEDGKPTPPWDFDVLAPCGALRSTVHDLMLYAKANLQKNNTPLSKAMELTHQITFDKGVKLGLAWHIITVNNVEYYFHNGGTYGSSSFLAFNPEKNIAVVVLANCGESTDAVGVNILKKLQ